MSSPSAPPASVHSVRVNEANEKYTEEEGKAYAYLCISVHLEDFETGLSV